SNFEDLPAQSQAEWLEYRWSDLKDPSWTPVLRKLAVAYQSFPEMREMTAYQSLRVSGTALKRWYELDPQGARSAVLAEIVRESPRYSADILGMLKDESLPEVEPVLAENLSRTTNYEIEGNILSLLERYGAGTAVPEVIASR